jgi:RHS repeat-associated protein
VDSEINGNGNAYDFGARMYDARLGRWWSVDPEFKKYPSFSSFVSFINNPLIFIDPNGDTIRVYGSKDEQWLTVGFLQTLTNDKLTVKNGIVQIEKMGGANKDSNFTLGTELIRELVSHKKQLWIVQNEIGKNSAETSGVGDVSNVYNGVGFHAQVNIDLTRESKLLTENEITKKTQRTVTPREITLSHELIHALMIMNGTLAKEGEYESYEYKNQEGKLVTDQAEIEELYTVGIKGSRKFTENKIRKEHNLPKRVKY